MLATTTQPVSELNLTYLLALIAAILSLAAFLVAWREAHRNNSALVRLMDFQASQTSTRSMTKYLLKVVVKNNGITLQSPHVALCFCGPSKSGSFSIPFSLEKKDEMSGMFVRGSLATYVLSSDDREATTMLSFLTDLREQDVALCVYNCSYLIKAFPVCRCFDFLRKRWNRLSFRLSYLRRVGEGTEGKGVFRRYQLPHFLDRKGQLDFFLSHTAPREDDNRCSS
jgi:hypothetical protein